MENGKEIPSIAWELVSKLVKFVCRTNFETNSQGIARTNFETNSKGSLGIYTYKMGK